MYMLSTPVLIPLSRFSAHCERLTRELVWGPLPVTLTVEVLSPTLGDQRPVESAPIRGITYDARNATLEIGLEDGDHRVIGVQEVWSATDGAESADLLEVVRGDGAKEILTLSRVRRYRSYRPRESTYRTSRT